MFRIQDPDLEKLLGFLSNTEEFVFLDTSKPDQENIESLLFLDPVDRLVCRNGDDAEEFLNILQLRLQEGYYLAGWIGYEFGAMLEGKVGVITTDCERTDGSVADLGVFLKPLMFNHKTGENVFPLNHSSSLAGRSYSLANLQPNMSQEEFVEALELVQQYIDAGDTYQVNYTMKLLFRFEGSAEKLYWDLRRNQSVAYGAYIRNGRERTLSFSPELFFRKHGAGITVRPMKGTAQRGRNSEEEQQNSFALCHDSKNKSENVMIVDLLRNDLSRLMHGQQQSRVFVESLFNVESYESLLQMTSTVKADTVDSAMRNIKLIDLFRALFPCGSITGAPKIRTMQIINELEKERRGVYTGAIGYFGPDGSAVFNVPIRTVRLQGKSGEMGIGAGITHDSDPVEEWKESLLKGRFLSHKEPDFQLFETMLWRPKSGFWMLDEHLLRLEKGAGFFKFSFDRDLLREQLQKEERNFDSRYYRVRICLQKDGRSFCNAMQCTVPERTALPLSPEKIDINNVPQIDFSTQKMDAENVWCFHKTTRREIYNTEYKKAQNESLFDYIFINNDGYVTEGCISNVIIYKDGQYLTPPVSCGLLAGVMRDRLLRDGTPVLEKILFEKDVRLAEAIYLCNSVRGIVRVRLIEFSGKNLSEPWIRLGPV